MERHRTHVPGGADGQRCVGEGMISNEIPCGQSAHWIRRAGRGDVARVLPCAFDTMANALETALAAPLDKHAFPRFRQETA